MEALKIIMVFLVLALTSCGQEKNKEKQSVKENSQVNKDSLIAVLDTIWKTEQYPIRLRDSLGDIYGYESKEFQRQQEIVRRNHAINEDKISTIIDIHGWPSKDIIGEQGNLTICNVIQHSDNEVRMEYIPIMRQAVKDKQLDPRLLVRAEDRIATERGGMQIYGGQMKYYPETKSFNVSPVYDPVNINKRRAEIGLGTIEEHLRNRFNFEWNLEEQIKRSAEFERSQNKEK